jgi:hypothetical protein
MAAMDQGMKAWLDLCKEDVLPWVVGEPVEYLGTFPTEIAPAPQLVPDKFYRVRVASRECLVNIEVQTDIDSEMDRRMYEYGSRATLDSKLAVFSVILWLNKDKQRHRPPKSPYKLYVGNRLRATWEFENIELYRLPPSAIMNTGAIGLLPLLPFTKDASAKMIENAMRRVKDEAPAALVQPLAALLGVFASRDYGPELALDLFRRLFMSTEILEQFPLFNMMIAEAEARGERKIIQQVLESRFGPLPQDMQAALKAADSAALSALSAGLATESLAQLRARLGLST